MSQLPSVYYHDPLFQHYDFGEGHAFAPIRQELTFDLVKRAKLIDPSAVRSAPVATEEELSLFHTADFIKAVKAVDQGGYTPPHYGIGPPDNPPFKKMHLAASARVGATLDAVRSVARGRFRRAANLSGGLHHAGQSKASGFCVYNDAGVAIAWLRKEHDCKVAYIDIDAHHGDGVQWGFYDDPNVLTVSIHESGKHLFPGTGDVSEIGKGEAAGSSVNIPLLPRTGSESWSQCFDLVVPDVVEAFKPDFIITQHGCDAHRYDPLTHLEVSVQTLDRAARTIRQLADTLTDGRWVALGGGGYAIWNVVPRAWALVWAVMTEQEVEETLPRDWLDEWSGQSPVALPDRWDDPTDELPAKDGADIEDEWRSQENRAVAQQARSTALSYLRP